MPDEDDPPARFDSQDGIPSPSERKENIAMIGCYYLHIATRI